MEHINDLKQIKVQGLPYQRKWVPRWPRVGKLPVQWCWSFLTCKKNLTLINDLLFMIGTIVIFKKKGFS